MHMTQAGKWLGFWLGGAVLWVVLFTLAPAPAEAASSLGWATTITTIFAEIRLIGFACLGGGIIVAGIELLFHRHLDRLGQVMASIGVGGALIIGGATGAIALTGAAGAPLGPGVAVLSRGEAWGDVVAQLAYHGTMLWTFVAVWREGRRRVQ